MHKDGHYKKFLTPKQLLDVKNIIRDYPEGIYSPDSSDENYDLIQCYCLDGIYWESIKFTGKKLIERGFDVKEQFQDYLDEDKNS